MEMQVPQLESIYRGYRADRGGIQQDQEGAVFLTCVPSSSFKGIIDRALQCFALQTFPGEVWYPLTILWFLRLVSRTDVCEC